MPTLLLVARIDDGDGALFLPYNAVKAESKAEEGTSADGRG